MYPCVRFTGAISGSSSGEHRVAEAPTRSGCARTLARRGRAPAGNELRSRLELFHDADMGWPWRTRRQRPSSVTSSACLSSKLATSASTACARSARAHCVTPRSTDQRKSLAGRSAKRLVSVMPDDFIRALPEGFIWFTLAQVRALLPGGYFNMDARSVFSCLPIRYDDTTS